MTKPTGRPPGRPRTPPELMALRGNPSGRPMADPTIAVKPDGIPLPPPQLRAAGKAAWKRYWTYGAQWLSETDVATITELCQIHDEEARLRRIMDREGWTHQVAKPALLESKGLKEILMQALEGDEMKVNLVLYQIEELAKETGDTKSRMHPLWQVSHQIRSRLLPLWIDAHMTPSSRGKANVRKAEVDPLAAWEAGKTG